MKVPDAALLDTNVFLLRLVALTDISLLKTFKRVQGFTPVDVDLLNQLLRPFGRLVSTPHVLGETSNFLQQAPPYRRRELMDTLRQFTKQSEESYEEARSLAERFEFDEHGLADTGLVSLSDRFVVFTTDSGLWGTIMKLGGLCINFSHSRARLLTAKGQSV